MRCLSLLLETRLQPPTLKKVIMSAPGASASFSPTSCSRVSHIQSRFETPPYCIFCTPRFTCCKIFPRLKQFFYHQKFLKSWTFSLVFKIGLFLLSSDLIYFLDHCTLEDPRVIHREVIEWMRKRLFMRILIRCL